MSATFLNTNLPLAFWQRIRVLENGCWLWVGHRNRTGYGQFHSQRRTVQAHRLAYETLVGPIPIGLQSDHLCHGADANCGGGDGCLHRACVNPSHLEPVTGRENVLRGNTIIARCAAATACPSGHPYDASNTYITPLGKRDCRVCRQEAGQRFRQRQGLANG